MFITGANELVLINRDEARNQWKGGSNTNSQALGEPNMLVVLHEILTGIYIVFSILEGAKLRTERWLGG